MGNVSGRLEDAPTLYLRDQSRLSIAALQVTNAQGRVILRIVPNGFPATRITPRKEADDGLLEYVQDPDPTSPIPLLLKIPYENELNFEFTLQLRRREDGTTSPPPDTVVNGLTFIAASTSAEVDNLVTREFHADPNLHKNPNVHLVGDFTTGGSPSVQFQYNWRWRPPREEKFGGWRNTCSFVEYDRTAHKLSTLAQFNFWVQNVGVEWPSSPATSPQYTLNAPPKLRIGSVSGSSRRNGRESDVEPPSPMEDRDIFDTSTLGGSITQVPTVKVDNCPRPNDNILGDDGPLFRATMKSLEQRTGSLRQKMKKMIKRAEAARAAMGACNEALRQFMESIKDASTAGNATGLQPALDHYFERTFREILLYEQQNEINIQKLVIEPLTKLYHTDIKQAEAKKRDFEEESRDYYSYVSRYLGIRNDSSKEKKKIDSETKYQTKRKNFELKRFDYSTFMQDLHGGRKEQEVLSQLTKFADAQARGFLATAKKVQEQLPELEALNYEVNETAKEFQMQRTEREERRRLLEINSTYVEPEKIPDFATPSTPSASHPSSSDILGFNTGFERLGPGTTTSMRAVSSGSEGGPDKGALGAMGLTSTSAPPVPTGSQKFRGGYVDQGINGEKESDRKKEGLLWALSRPGSHVDPKGLNKQAWHKYWVVLAGGQLCEYSNWKQKLDLHNDPINLRMASVREARNSERRFCFEVVTPQYKRVYQATSEEDMHNWIQSINNAVKSTIEGGNSVKSFDPVYEDSHTSSPLKNITTALTGKTPSHHHSVHGQNPLTNNNSAASSIHRRITVGARPNTIRRNSSNFGDDPEKLVQLIREADPSNMNCADCGSQQQTQWVSINLGIVLCIECSGLHRSLGTHISKVRSLTLDTTSFTPDLVDLLCQIGNRKSNSVWTARAAPSDHPVPQSSREARLKFINQKYVQRLWVTPISPTLSPFGSADEMLLDACKRNDIQAALYALALKANPNAVDPSTGCHAVLLALHAADSSPPLLATPVTAEPPKSPGGPSTQQDRTFPLAELLMQNSAEIPYPVNTDGLSAAAKNYVAAKTAKRFNQSSSGATGMQGADSGAQGSSGMAGRSASVALREKQEKLQKRVSSGARLHRAPGLGER